MSRVKSFLHNIKWYEYIFMIILVVFPFIHVAYGIDLTDTTYSLGNFENFTTLNKTWAIATFGANIIGRALTYLPFGHTFLGMNIYTSAFLAIFTVAIFLLLRRYIPSYLVFIGDMLALFLCWAPHTVLYHYFSYYCFSLVAILLIMALCSNNRIIMAVCGYVLGFSMFVRFPNIVDCALILVVIFNGILQKDKLKRIITDVCICIAGFLSAVIVNLIIIMAVYGTGSFFEMIGSLFGMTESATGYSPVNMVYAIVNHAFIYRRPAIFIMLLTMFLTFLYYLTVKKWMKYLFMFIEMVMFAAYLFWAYRNYIFVTSYEVYEAFVAFAIIFIMLSMLLSAIVMFFSKGNEIKLMGLTNLLLIALTPLGSNNGFFPVFNNLFVIAPFTFYFAYTLIFKDKSLKELIEDKGFLQFFPIRMMLVLFILVFLYQSGRFGIHFIFRDPGFPKQNNVKIENIDVIRGMHTNPENAENIEMIANAIKENGVEGKEAVFFGQFPGYSYILSMPCAIGHSWAVLPSFTYKEMEEEFSRLDGDEVFFVDANLVNDINNTGETLQKATLVNEYLRNNDYEAILSQNDVVIYIKNNQ